METITVILPPDETTYSGYVSTDKWKAKRDAVRKRDKRICQLCKHTGHIVHHLTYERITKERLDDLILLCVDCHKFVHQKPDHPMFPTHQEVKWKMFPETTGF